MNTLKPLFHAAGGKLMNAKHVFLIASLWIGASTLVACGSRAVTPATAPTTVVLDRLTPGNDPDVPPIDSNNPACQGLLGVDLVKAANRYGAKAYPTLWTFSLNFKKFDEKNNPYGCVRFYVRDLQTSKFYTTPAEVEVPCYVDGAVDFKSASVDTVTSVKMPFSTVGWAEFHGGRIVCKLNLATMATSAPTVNGIQPYLSPTYVYTNFAMATIGSNFPSDQQTLYPILHYEPVVAQPQDPLASLPISHSIGKYDPEEGYYASFNNVTYGPGLNHHSEALQDWWIYNWQDRNHTQQITFERLEANVASFGSWSTQSGTSVEPVHFWTGDAVLTIGAVPGVELHTGTLYEVVIDPTGGSKPPGQD